MTAVEILFWACLALIAYTHLGYPLVLLAMAGHRGDPSPPAPERWPAVSLIVAAHNEEDVIGSWVRAARAIEYQDLEVVVASDGSTDRTAEVAREAGADLVLELPRGGKVAALNAAVARARGELLAFADANATWEPDALGRLVARLKGDRVGYVCGQLRLDGGDGTNQEGLYWRYEMAVRAMESRLAGVTAGNGAINAVRREAYIALEPTRGQDISLPFELRRRGWLSVYEPRAVARERAADSLASEFARKRRMLTGAWAAVLRYGIGRTRGYGAAYAFEIYSHRVLRYVSPVLHLILLAANVVLVREAGVYAVTLALQGAFLAAAGLAPVAPLRPLRVARYYVVVTAAGLAALWDYLRHGVPATWERAEGTR